MAEDFHCFLVFLSVLALQAMAFSLILHKVATLFAKTLAVFALAFLRSQMYDTACPQQGLPFCAIIV